MSQGADPESMVSVFASDQPHELGAVLDTLGAASIPAVSARSRYGLGGYSRGGRFDPVINIYVPIAQEAAARAALQALPFPSHDGSGSPMTQAELQRGHLIVVAVLLALFLGGLVVIFGDPNALFAPLSKAVHRLLG
jgi:hypothetical protein